MHENPCWTCQKACGGCSWSRSFSPVPGWRANKTKKRGQGGTKGGYIESYYIRSCPEYDPEPKRDIPEERGGQRLKYDIDKVMLLARAGMTEAEICQRMGGMPLDTLRKAMLELEQRALSALRPVSREQLSEFKTCDLVDELRKREGVETHIAEPYQDVTVSVNGPAVVLVVID